MGTSENKEKQCDDKDDAKYTTVETSLRMIEEEESPDLSLSDLDDQQLIDAFEDTWICKDCAAINQSSEIRCSNCDKDKPIPEIIQRKKPDAPPPKKKIDDKPKQKKKNKNSKKKRLKGDDKPTPM